MTLDPPPRRRRRARRRHARPGRCRGHRRHGDHGRLLRRPVRARRARVRRRPGERLRRRGLHRSEVDLAGTASVPGGVGPRRCHVVPAHDPVGPARQRYAGAAPSLAAAAGDAIAGGGPDARRAPRGTVPVAGGGPAPTRRSGRGPRTSGGRRLAGRARRCPHDARTRGRVGRRRAEPSSPPPPARGVLVSLGHTDATGPRPRGLRRRRHRRDPPLERHPTDHGRAIRPSPAVALTRPDVWVCAIADLVHVSAETLTALDPAAGDRFVVITDAMAGGGPTAPRPWSASPTAPSPAVSPPRAPAAPQPRRPRSAARSTRSPPLTPSAGGALSGDRTSVAWRPARRRRRRARRRPRRPRGARRRPAAGRGPVAPRRQPPTPQLGSPTKVLPSTGRYPRTNSPGVPDEDRYVTRRTHSDDSATSKAVTSSNVPSSTVVVQRSATLPYGTAS